MDDSEEDRSRPAQVLGLSEFILGCCAQKLNKRKPRLRKLKKFEGRLTCPGPSSLPL
jgi:hypothetical protein